MAKATSTPEAKKALKDGGCCGGSGQSKEDKSTSPQEQSPRGHTEHREQTAEAGRSGCCGGKTGQ
jgi:hypothetical protein